MKIKVFEIWSSYALPKIWKFWMLTVVFQITEEIVHHYNQNHQSQQDLEHKIMLSNCLYAIVKDVFPGKPNVHLYLLVFYFSILPSWVFFSPFSALVFFFLLLPSVSPLIIFLNNSFSVIIDTTWCLAFRMQTVHCWFLSQWLWYTHKWHGPVSSTVSRQGN